MGNPSAVVRISYQLTADFIFLTHLIFVSIVAVGWLISELFYLHLTLIAASSLSEIFLGYCLLTRWEFSLRKKLDPTLSFDSSCIIHYLRKWQGLGPRPAIVKKTSFFKKNSFFFILLTLGILSFVFRFLI